MRIETVKAWMCVGFLLLIIGAGLHTFEVKLAIFVGAVGFVYFMIGLVLAHIHNQHMAERTRAGRE